MPPTLLHVANVRLGTTFTALGTHGREQRAQVLATLLSLGDMAIREGVHAVLISGDLFDTAVPAPETLKAVQGFFSTLHHAGIAAVILPGARDPDGIFQPGRQRDDDLCPGAIILGAECTCARLEGVNVIVRAVPLPTGGPATSELFARSVHSEPEVSVIGLAYAHAGRTEIHALARGFAGTGMSYVGIGGNPAFAVQTVGATVVCSPGVPEPLDWEQETGSVALVHIDTKGLAEVERRRTGKRSFARRTLHISPENARVASSEIARMGRPDLALEVTLSGECPADLLIDTAMIEAEVAPLFFHVRVIDGTRLVSTAPVAGGLPQGTVLGNFARVMDGRMRDVADAQQAALDREAYHIGMSLLQGGSDGT